MKQLITLTILMVAFLACDNSNSSSFNGKACFNYSPDSDISVNQEISFTSCSEVANWFFWDFGDGNTSTLENPTHTYTSPGTYSVNLIIQNTSSTDVNMDGVINEMDVLENSSDELIQEIVII